MSSCDINGLISLLEKGQVSKDELIKNINKIKFKEISLPLTKPTTTNTLPNGENNSQSLSLLEENLDKTLKKMKVGSKGNRESIKFLKWTKVGSDDKKLELVKKGRSVALDSNHYEYEATFFERMETGELHRMTQRSLAKIEKEQKEMQECSFKPKTNGKLLSEETRGRLHKLQKNKFIISQIRKETNYYNTNNNKDLTFSPVIHSKDAKSRYMSSINTPSLTNNNSFCATRYNSPESTFRSKINPSSKLIQKKKKDSVTGPQPRSFQSPQKFQSSKNNSKPPTDTQQTQKNIDKFNDFLERQSNFEFLKKCKNQKLLNQLAMKSSPNRKIPLERNKSKETHILTKLDLFCNKNYKNTSIAKKEGSFSSEINLTKTATSNTGKGEMSPIDHKMESCNVNPSRVFTHKSSLSTFSSSQFKLHDNKITEFNKTQSIINQLYKQMEDCRKIIELTPTFKTDESLLYKPKPLQSMGGNFTGDRGIAGGETNISKV